MDVCDCCFNDLVYRCGGLSEDRFDRGCHRGILTYDALPYIEEGFPCVCFFLRRGGGQVFSLFRSIELEMCPNYLNCVGWDCSGVEA